MYLWIHLVNCSIDTLATHWKDANGKLHHTHIRNIYHDLCSYISPFDAHWVLNTAPNFETHFYFLASFLYLTQLCYKALTQEANAARASLLLPQWTQKCNQEHSCRNKQHVHHVRLMDNLGGSRTPFVAQRHATPTTAEDVVYAATDCLCGPKVTILIAMCQGHYRRHPH